MVAASDVVVETSKLLVELMNWDFASDEKFAYSFRKDADGDRERQRATDLLTLPRKWAGVFLQAGFVDGVCNAYEKLRVVHGHYCATPPAPGAFTAAGVSPAAAAMKATERAMSELRLLISAVASITGSFFVDDAEKVSLCSQLVARVVPLLTASLDRSRIAGASSSGKGATESRALEDLRAAECLHWGAVVLRLLGNFRLAVASRMAPALFEGLVTALARATFEVSQELALLADLQLTAIYAPSGGTGDGGGQAELAARMGLSIPEGETSLLTGWRGDAVEVLLDAWCMVMDDPLMMHSSLSAGGLGSPRDGGDPHRASAYAVAQVRVRLYLSPHLRPLSNFLSNLSMSDRGAAACGPAGPGVRDVPAAVRVHAEDDRARVAGGGGRRGGLRRGRVLHVGHHGLAPRPDQHRRTRQLRRGVESRVRVVGGDDGGCGAGVPSGVCPRRGRRRGDATRRSAGAGRLARGDAVSLPPLRGRIPR